VRKIIATLVAAIGLAATMLVIGSSSTASADVIGAYGHNDTWFDISGNVTCSTCSDRRIRVGVEVRRITPSNMDVNVCTEHVLSAPIARKSIDYRSLIKDSSYTLGSNSTQLISSTNYFCSDLDPNPAVVCGPSRNSYFLGHADVGVRRTDGVLLHIFGNSDNVALPCD
jgi:hypothetical protein